MYKTYKVTMVADGGYRVIVRVAADSVGHAAEKASLYENAPLRSVHSVELSEEPVMEYPTSVTASYRAVYEVTDELITEYEESMLDYDYSMESFLAFIKDRFISVEAGTIDKIGYTHIEAD